MVELQTNVKTGELKLTSPEQTEVVTKEVVTKEPDLVTRASQVKIEPEQKETEEKFDMKALDAQIEKIQDPIAKEQIMGLKKSLLKGENEKYQHIANLRKQYETELAKTNVPWTPERVQVLLNDPNFVTAAQSVLKVQPQAEENYSALSEREQQKLQQLEAELRQMKEMNWSAVKTQQDAQLQVKYANYKPGAVDTLTAELLNGKYQATREDLWKALDYDEAVRRAYQLGLQDKKTQTQEKMDSSSAEGVLSVRSDSVLERNKNESNQDYFRRIFQNNLDKQKTEQIRK